MCGAHLTKTLRPLAQRGDIGNKLRLKSHSAHLDEVGDTLRLVQVLQAYRSHGHLHATLDPLERLRGPWFTECQNWATPRNATLERLGHLDRKLSTNEKAAWLAAQLGMEVPTTSSREFYVGGALSAGEPLSLDTWSLPAVIEHMQDAYCGTLTAELDHLASQEEQRWLAERVERREPISAEERVRILRMLVHADEFERFLALHFPKSKRFGVEGCEALLPGVDALVGRCAAAGVRRIEVGMAHRGRLSLLCNLLHKPPGALFAQMENGQSDYRVGDVKYHLGDTATLAYGGGADKQEIRMSIAPNPSHLEAVNPVVMGLVRAVQTRLGSGGRTAVAGLLIHGDAAFAGLGIVAECLQLSNTPGFTVGGMLHIVVNNQVGFTTAPREGRSSVHATDMAKAVGAPVLHANADDPEAVVAACRIAADWRARWRKDVVVDLVGYRRHGHNELDDPQATLPLTYERIQEHPRVLDIYAARLAAQGLIPASLLDSLKAEVQAKFEEEFASYEAGLYREQPRDWLATSWQGDALQAMASEPSIRQAPEPKQEPTGLPLATLQWVGRSICRAPPDFSRHPEVERLCQGRLAMVKDKNSRVDFGMAEALAFGTLALHRGVRPPGVSAGGQDFLDRQPSTLDSQLQQEELIGKDADASAGLNLGSYAVRLSGQDVERGTFNHRHAVQYDCRTAKRRVALDEIQPGMQERVEVWNSPLSEAAVLGFEYGYSLGNERRGLTAFEAQFGDFINNAQCIIDQFISAGEERWGQTSGLVLQLPHGFEGQGPDHSSARMERFLQLANDDADHLPGNSPAQLREISATFAALAKEYGGQLNREQIVEVLRGAGVGEGGELAELLWTEMGLSEDAHITQAAWEGFMVQYSRRFAERQANLFVVCATTPAQLFHALRRQMNRPFAKPLVLLTPKYLLHHRPATSALADFTVGTFFNRVIDDGKASDNTRHKAVNPATGEPFLLPPDQIRRVILCCGQIYYNLSLARRSRRIRDTVLVRLEQITPFPSDLLYKVITQYGNAEVMWCQEEPKNMGAYFYIKPRLATAMRDLGPPASAPPRPLRYVGRTASASVATASIAIHRIETKHIIDSALSPGPIKEDVKI